ncbi:MAG: FtsX-like permease family protein [Desulfobacterales bacterium]|jgi:putative ABC transport system permease protein
MRRLGFFLRFFNWFSLRHLRRHRFQAILVLGGIALGAAVFTSVRLSVHASLASFTQSMDHIAGRADRVLVRPGGFLPEKIISRVLKHPVVRYASPLMTAYVKIFGVDAEPFLLIGIDPILDRSFRSWQVARAENRQAAIWLDLIKEPYTLVLGKSLARQYGYTAGGTILVEHSRQSIEFRIAGELAPEGLALVDNGRVAFTDIATFQEFTGLHGKLDRIDVLLAPETTSEQLHDLVTTLPEGVVLSSPSERRESGQAMIRAYQLNLSILSFASLFVGMFLVYSLVALNTASRRHELAVLRSTGASARFLFSIFLAEGAIFGVAGWLLAIPLSGLLIKYLLYGVSQTISSLFVRVQVEQLSLSAWEILLSFVVTLFISILAAFQPARMAMKVSPQEAMNTSRHLDRSGKSIIILGVIGVFCIVLVWPLSQLPSYSGVPLPGYVATLLLFSGFALLSPWMLDKFGKRLSPMLRNLGGLPAYLAGRHIRDSGNRTAISVGALITAVALYVSLVVMIHSFRQTVEMWAHQTVSGDLFATTKMGEINQFRYPISPEVVKILQNLDAAVDIVPNRRYFLTYEKFPYEFEALAVEVFLRYGSFVWLQGTPGKVLPQLIRGDGVIVSEVFSNRTGLSSGDLFRARIETSRIELPILGVVRDYRTQGGVVFYALPEFKKRYHDPGWGGVRFFFSDRNQNLDASVSALRREIVEKSGDKLAMISGKELRQSILTVFDETFAITTVLLFIALVIAALGITTTLAVLVLERTRQLNTLYAVGASFGQIRSMIFWESILMVMAGEIAGLICGLFLSYLLVFVINRQSFGWTFLYGLDLKALIFSLPLIILTALLAALPAVRLVFREPPATLLRES